MKPNPHPTRSPEFLSRLHDGELSPGERAHFESHRAHCSECRTAAAEFEAALTLYRTSIPSPADPDLAARILRKLRSSGTVTRRQRFGPTFGIDLRWAGAFAAAVIAAIVGSSIVAKNEARERAAARSAVPAVLEKLPAEAAPPAAGAPFRAGPGPGSPESRASSPGPSFSSLPSARRAFAPKEAEEKTDADALQRDEGRIRTGKIASADAEKGKADRLRPNAAGGVNAIGGTPILDQAQSVEGSISDKKRERQAAPAAAAPPPAVMKSVAEPRSDTAAASAPAPERRADAFAPSPNRDTDRQGGEGGNQSEQQQQAAAPLRFVVSALGGGPSAPDLLPGTGGVGVGDYPASLRGHQFVLFVDAAGRVRQVRPWPELRGGRRSNANDSAARAKEKDSPSPLLTLRFQPGDAPRRLLVRVE